MNTNSCCFNPKHRCIRPNSLLSYGTLRMLASTLPAFLPARPAVYIIEEPENVVHPKALEIIMRALGAIPQARVFVATHSPLVVPEAGVAPLLCFWQDENRAHIVRGPQHPARAELGGVARPGVDLFFADRVGEGG